MAARVTRRRAAACPTAQTFVDVVQRLYAEQFTGEITIRWAQGHPRVVEFPAAPTRILLDTGRDCAHT
jgi:hypothetical protein